MKSWFRLSHLRLLALLAIYLVSGCATRRQVEDAVALSNAASLTASGAIGTLDPQHPTRAPWQDAAAKLENLIAEHPDNSTMVAALRLRQAVLYLQAQQPDLAHAAFDLVQLSDLKTARDKALKNLQESLLWWYVASASQSFSRNNNGNDFVQATNAMRLLSQEWEKLKTPEDQTIRDYLAGVRVFIGVKLANDSIRPDDPRQHLTNAVNTYSAMLPASEVHEWITATNWATRNWSSTNFTQQTALLPIFRRHFQADAVISAANTAISNNAISGPLILTNEYFRKRILAP